jgi:hypothetical protein
MRRVVVWAGAVAIFVAGCGGGGAPGGPETGLAGGGACPQIPVVVDPFAPPSTQPTPTSPSPSAEAMAQNALQPDYAIALDYGRGHPEEWGGIEFDGDNVKIGFTAHLLQHQAELDRLVTHPAQLQVVRTDQTQRAIDTITAEIDAVASSSQGQLESVGEGFGVVDISLAPGREDVAASYVRRFGSAVAITVGALPYVPRGCGSPPPVFRCPDLVGSDPASAGLSVTIVVDTPTISRYESGRAHLVVRNTGTATFTMDTGQPIVAQVTRPGTTHVVADFVGGIAGTGNDLRLDPGQQRSVPVYFGTARCDGRPGSAVPPGRYAVRAILRPETTPSEPAYLSAEEPVTISDAPPPPVPDPPVLAPAVTLPEPTPTMTAPAATLEP